MSKLISFTTNPLRQLTRQMTSQQMASFKMIDIGANLGDPVFRGIFRGKQKHQDDFEEMLQRSRDVGVEKLIITGGSLHECRDVLELARSSAMENLFCTVGVHPTRCNEFLENPHHMDQLLDICRDGMVDGKVVAIGECGLDYDRLEFCSKEVQLEYFEKQFELAEKTGLPMFLHNRNTKGDFIDVIRKNRNRFSCGVVHSFDGTMEEASALIDMGLFIGINGCSLKTQENLQVMSQIPVDKLMIETDAPWCEIRPTHASYPHVRTINQNVRKPEKFELGKLVKGRNEPCNLIQILEVIANCRNLDPTSLANQIYNNTNQVFFRQSTQG